MAPARSTWSISARSHSNFFDDLPNELLRLIFEEVVTVSDEPEPGTRTSRADIGHTLCDVSTRFRTIALRTSSLWETLVIFPFAKMNAVQLRRFQIRLAAWTGSKADSLYVHVWDTPEASPTETRLQLRSHASSTLGTILTKEIRKKWRSCEVVTANEARMNLVMSFVQPRIFRALYSLALKIRGSVPRSVQVKKFGRSKLPVLQRAELCHVSLPAYSLECGSLTSLYITVSAKGARKQFRRLWSSLGAAATSLKTLSFSINTGDKDAFSLPNEQRVAFVNTSVRHLTLHAACVPPLVVNGSFTGAEDLTIRSLFDVHRCFEYLGLVGLHRGRQFCNGGTLAQNIRFLQIDLHRTGFAAKQTWKNVFSRISGTKHVTLTSEFYEWDPSYPDPTTSTLTISVVAGGISTWPRLEQVVLCGRSASMLGCALESLAEAYEKKGALDVDFSVERETDAYLRARRTAMYGHLTNVFKYGIL